MSENNHSKSALEAATTTDLANAGNESGAKNDLKIELQLKDNTIDPAEGRVDEVDVQVRFPDGKEVLEIELHLKDDTFDVTKGTGDEMDIKVHLSPRLKIGVALVAFSFLMSGFVFIMVPWAIATENHALEMTCGTIYFASWIVLGVGVLVGGQAARKIVTSWRVNFHNAIKNRIKIP